MGVKITTTQTLIGFCFCKMVASAIW